MILPPRLSHPQIPPPERQITTLLAKGFKAGRFILVFIDLHNLVPKKYQFFVTAEVEQEYSTHAEKQIPDDSYPEV